jgi:hypothetical protein
MHYNYFSKKKKQVSIIERRYPLVLKVYLAIISVGGVVCHARGRGD